MRSAHFLSERGPRDDDLIIFISQIVCTIQPALGRTAHIKNTFNKSSRAASWGENAFSTSNRIYIKKFHFLFLQIVTSDLRDNDGQIMVKPYISIKAL